MKKDTILVPVKASEELPPNHIGPYFTNKGELYYDPIEKVFIDPKTGLPIISNRVKIWWKETTKSELVKQELGKVMPSEDEDIERSGIAYDYLSGKGVFKDMNPQHQIDIQEALRMSAGTHGYKQSLQPKEPHNLETLDNNHLDEKA